MIANTDRVSIVAAVILGIFLFAGLATGGYFIGKGTARFKSESRTVTVKGLIEKEVKADKAVWVLTFRRAGDDLQEAHSLISIDREAAIAFLKAQGFKDEEIGRQPTRTIDKFAREYGQANEKFRYLVNGSLVVTTKNVDLVTKALGETEALLQSGIILDGIPDSGTANPRYIVSSFNELRPKLLADATKNARATAQQFAADSGTQIGRIRSANQGMIQIFGSDGNDESASYSPTSTPLKKIRVVSTFDFELI
ncbi:MAG: SIMPL domain-containing protein [Deltaproteobacteria bacterium]|nr:SIMPL domain-containing protein [Deltaproteobacteria bacterium]